MATGEPQSFHEIAVTVRSEDVDAVANYIIENISGGLLLEDEDGASETTIKFYVADDIDVDPLLSGLRRYLAAVDQAYESVALSRKRIARLDWIDAYRKSTVPIMVGDSIVVKPPWNTDFFPGRTEIVIEPKMAFGTGRHESTQGCLAMLEKIDLSGKRVLDIGCGSGILCIYAAKRGASDVIGYDIDPLAVENSVENFILNGVNGVCHAFPGTISEVNDGRLFDVVIVNIIKSVIVPIVGFLKALFAPDGILILSGLLQQDRDEVDAALKRHDLNSFDIRDDNGWLTYRIAGT